MSPLQYAQEKLQAGLGYQNVAAMTGIQVSRLMTDLPGYKRRPTIKSSSVIPPTPEAAPVVGHLTVKAIQEAVADHYGLRVEFLTGRNTTRRVTMPRQMAMYLCRKMTLRSLPDIGRRFNRDHTTVLYAIRETQLRLQHDPELREDETAIFTVLTGVAERAELAAEILRLEQRLANLREYQEALAA